jgi:hypothetical protein
MLTTDNAPCIIILRRIAAAFRKGRYFAKETPPSRGRVYSRSFSFFSVFSALFRWKRD